MKGGRILMEITLKKVHTALKQMPDNELFMKRILWEDGLTNEMKYAFFKLQLQMESLYDVPHEKMFHMYQEQKENELVSFLIDTFDDDGLIEYYVAKYEEKHGTCNLHSFFNVLKNRIEPEVYTMMWNMKTKKLKKEMQFLYETYNHIESEGFCYEPYIKSFLEAEDIDETHPMYRIFISSLEKHKKELII